MGKHLFWVDSKEAALEKRVLSEYAGDEVRKHHEYLTTLTRIAGTDDERKAAEYIKGKLDEFGIEAEIYEFDAYISHPGEAELEILSPVQKSFPSLAHGFISSTPPEGIEAELVPVGKGTAEDFRTKIVKGKIVLVESEGGDDQVRATEVVRIAEKNGAIGGVFVARGSPRSISYMRLRNAWGSPIPETIDQIPKTPAISVCNEDGTFLAELAGKSPVVVRLKAEAWRGYKKVRQPTGTLRGMKEPETYVLFATHYCSWYIGATDNAAANSLLLEMARLFSNHRKDLARSIRFAWWTAHSQGTAGGSSWYADNFWDDIRDHAFAYVNMDGLARAGSSGFAPENTEEIRKFQEGVIREVLGLEVTSKRVSRSRDQSFWGIGVPYFSGETKVPPSPGRTRVWYSHAAEDTPDKADLELLHIPFKANAVSVLRLCNNPILPFDYVTVLGVFKSTLNELQEKSHSVLDLSSLITQVEALEKKIEALTVGIEKSLSDLEKKKKGAGLEKKLGVINGCLTELCHIFMPVLSSKSGRYGQDPMGTKFKPIPTLQPLLELISMEGQSDEFRALRTSLLRERNRLSDALSLAHRTLDQTLDRI